MKKLNQNLFNHYFSHIYIEDKAMGYDTTKKILQHFKDSNIIHINHYKDVFSRSHQNFSLQKQSPALILAVKEENLIYKGAEVCESFGNDNFYYTSSIMNCLYDCEYCYLQGMYPSANLVVFVNIKDIFSEVEKLLNKHPVYLCISYDTDILSFENLLGYVSKWLNFAKNHENLKLEIRTKSANFKAIEKIEANKNVILAWTLSPQEIITSFEHRTPSLENRLKSAAQAIEKNWQVRICFDPVLYYDNWKEYYKELIKKTFTTLPPEKIHDVSIGFFRVSKDYLKIMKKKRKDSILINYPYETKDKVSSYAEKLTKEMSDYVYSLVKEYIDEIKIYL